ncbi:uncharacterized protein PHACADRAFT_176840 [Phanerochaete carnosa HHB-10118-sp]|uniref:Wax synthase domain-containing protein n=1 Tax=Phanerochaete carnosa (strain HHB-10118-sp) TaxID=650164 RepID=K5W1T8_PHACS|nr:uncharacterized protein PHACADRAFT_176840 [Phanerochaete carnosa HHB-10118-sp]EKM52834.1 hypothetical protein PHACADRAFT_176840 [Phanerochaete carnosa HHB-10118-sp]
MVSILSARWFGEERPPLPLGTHVIAPHIVLALLLAVKPRPYLSLRLSAWVALTAALSYATRIDTGDDFDNWSVGILLICLSFTAFVLLVLWDPVVDYRHESWQPEQSMSRMPFWKRTGIGWNYQIPHLPPRPTHTRPQFVVSRTFRVVWYIFIADIAQTYIGTNPLFSLSGDTARSMRSQGPLLMLPNVTAYMAISYCTLNIYYDATAIFAVAFGFSRAKDWPVVFGRWREAYTVRRFWRYFASAIGKAIARNMGCMPGSRLSSQVQLFIGFALSGLAHVHGDLMLHPQWVGYSFPFFMYHAAFITLEDCMISTGRRLGIRESWWTRGVGHVWTYGWLIYALPWLNDWHLRAGMGTHRIFRFSIIRPLLEWVAASWGVDIISWIALKCAV